ncbi:MAG: DUF4416 family protein [Fibrobacteria bacterium]|nr:DUF4416 family protein [Fibrobacteria bacterium]
MNTNYLSKPLIFVLAEEERLPAEVYGRLEKSFWPIAYLGKAHAFNITDYYAQEFGLRLYRHIVAFSGLMNPENLAEYKWISYFIEKAFMEGSSRKYNLDFGYLDADKLVLASFKRGKNKIYLGNEIYADMLLEYAKGNFTALPWAFPDFKDGRYHKDLLVVREKLKAQLRKCS